MNIAKTLITSLLLATSMAWAQDLPPTKTFEVSSNGFRMARSPQGTVGLKECETCDFHRLRVTERTRYQVDGRSMRFEKFLDALENLELHGEFFLNVVRDETTGTVSKIFIYSQ